MKRLEASCNLFHIRTIYVTNDDHEQIGKSESEVEGGGRLCQAMEKTVHSSLGTLPA